MDETPSENNVFKMIDGGSKSKENDLPQFDYIVEALDGSLDRVYGFPVFSPQYVMVMRELDDGVTVPCYMRPIDQIKAFVLDETDDDEDELPF